MGAGANAQARAQTYGLDFAGFVAQVAVMESPPTEPGVIFEGLKVTGPGGLWSQCVRHVLGQVGAFVLDGMRPVEGLRELMGLPLAEAHRNKREARPVSRPLPTGTYPDWYNGDGMRAVGSGDTELIERFGAIPFLGLRQLVQTHKGTRWKTRSMPDLRSFGRSGTKAFL